ncbi:MAG TPA: ABC transporter permease [Chloroflexia bacterium]|nr:ABC transporter permease [Chloroflexia bacterium]
MLTEQRPEIPLPPSFARMEALQDRPLRRLDWEATYGIWLRDIKKFWREKSRLWGGIARPVLWLLILGSSLKPAISNSSLAAGGAIDYTHYIFPGVIGLTLIFASLQSATSIIWDREFGFLKEVMAAPVPRLSILLGKALGGATQATMQGIITLMFAPLIGLWLNPLVILALIVMMFTVSFALTTLGVVIASSMTSFEGFGTISNFVVMPMYFLSGAIYPTSIVPIWIKPLIIINPLSYGVDALRQITVNVGAFPFWFDLGFLVVFAVIMLVLAVPLFSKEK